MSAFDSAIDDTFGISRLTNQSEKHDDESLFDNAYVGPRDGHWEVTSSVGSFVDDRCPTVYGYRHKPRGNGYGYGTQMDEGLAKRLMQATIQEKRATAVSAAKDATPRAEVYNENQHSPTPLRTTALEPKPFIVPPLRRRPYQPVTPDTPKIKRPATKSSEAKSPPEQHQEVTAATRSLSSARTPVKAATLHSEAKISAPRNSTSTGHSIRILGKNGEEAFVNLPSLPKTFSEAFSVNGRTLTGTPTERSQQGPIHKAQSQSPQPTAGHGSKTSTKHNADKTSNTTANKRQAPEQQSDRASLPPTISPIQSRRASPTMMMSGALPPSSSKGSSKPVSAASSCKDSGIAMGGMSAVVSNVNTRKASTRASGSAISRGVLSVAQEIANMPAASAKQSRSASVASTPSLFEEVGEGVTTGFPRQKKASVHSKQPTKDSIPGSRPGSRRSASSNGSYFKSTQQPSKKDALLAGYKPPTVRSASSSSSVTHSFGGFLQDNSAQPTNNQNGWDFDRHESVDSRPSQSHSVEDKHAGSSRGRMKTASTVTPPIRTKFRLDVSPPSDQDEHPCPSHSPVSAFAPSHRAPSPPPSLTAEEPTRFAGGGWISPHPLSVADTDIGAPPQSAVYISAKDVGKSGTLTYNQWKSQRDAAQSISGSFAGSHVPSAVELQTIPAEAYGHPPPTGYVGSFREQTRQSFHQASGRLYDNQQWNETFGQQSTRSRVTVRPAHSREPSAHSQSSVYTHFPSPSTGQHNAVYDGPIQEGASVFAQNDARTTQNPYDHFGPDRERAPAPGYVVGLTPRELSKYQQSLSNTVSHYSTQLSGLQDERTPAQPDYDVWNNTQSRASRRAASEHSVHAFPPNLSYPREKITLPMPWDRTSSREGSSTVIPGQAHSQRSASDWGDSHRSGTTQVASGEYLEPRNSAAGSQASGRSGRMANEPLSQVTYGAAEWQDLEDAEDGRGRYESHHGRRMW